MGAASIPSDLAARAIPFLDCFVATLLATTERVARNDTPLVVARLTKSAEAISGWGTWREVDLAPFSRKSEVAFAYYLAQFSG
jgi:hypothetical protein